MIPSRLRGHAVYFDEESRISRRIEEMAEIAFVSSPNRDEILQSVRKLHRNIEMRREIFENLEETLINQENWLKEYMDSLRKSQR